ncbi:hypothetical protein AUC71_07710 [Methyloceanibacter marginalis]|uniref:Abortive infection protein-like C-terminal domain-containing protein n=1 Tax=Methyloceanibacter marginalis TaxID=1774971 RepID=A0A1E3WD74_9HYPH|nr:hypothetical protein [Methyloceanibacter marginalis]ODS03784.1 hypothetical protein AUC71_07710 [Methyloceanibacter marginalis]
MLSFSRDERFPTTSGQRFSELYIERGAPERDSARMRRRLAALVSDHDYLGDLRSELQHSLGIDGPSGNYGYQWVEFYKQAALRDVLDSITVAWRLLARNVQSGSLWDRSAPGRWVKDIGQILREENLPYELDARGGVHLTVDQEFERNRATVIAGLDAARYANVAQNLENAHSELSAVTPDGRGAIRAAFDSVEGLFKLMFPKEPRLTAPSARTKLAPVLQKMTDGNPPASAAAAKMLGSLCEWVASCHNYRHEHGKPEVLEPPRSMAVLLVSTAASYLRWLAEIDAWLKSQESV